jgi:hypothetical protein
MGDAGPEWARTAKTEAPPERGHEAVIQETQAMLSGLLTGSKDMAEYASALQREATAWAEVECLQAELRARDAAPAPGAAELAHIARALEDHESHSAAALSVVDSALAAATRRAASDAAVGVRRTASEAQRASEAGAREAVLIARAEQVQGWRICGSCAEGFGVGRV